MRQNNRLVSVFDHLNISGALASFGALALILVTVSAAHAQGAGSKPFITLWKQVELFDDSYLEFEIIDEGVYHNSTLHETWYLVPLPDRFVGTAGDMRRFHFSYYNDNSHHYMDGDWRADNITAPIPQTNALLDAANAVCKLNGLALASVDYLPVAPREPDIRLTAWYFDSIGMVFHDRFAQYLMKKDATRPQSTLIRESMSAQSPTGVFCR